MQKDRLLVGLTFVFAAMTATVLLVALAAFEPVLFVVAVPLAAATAMFWYQSSGKLRERVARSRRRGTADGPGGGFGAGARREARRDRERARRGRRQQRRGRRQRRDRAAGQAASGLSPAEAYRRLGLDPDADESDVRRAYRRKVKEVHPDRGGDEEEFKRVTEAYEVLVG